MRRLALLLTGLAILSGINLKVWRFEHALSSGEVVLLKLAPIDPRSLMQGDYMRLNYDLARQLGSQDLTEHGASEPLVIRLDEQQVAHWVADGKPEALAQDQRLLQARRQDDQWLIGPDAFFFEEGQAKQFEAARYGEFRLQEDGEVLLVGLRDEGFRPIGQRRATW